MTRRRTSPIWTISKEDLQKLLNELSSFVEVLKSLGLNAHSGNHRTLQQRIKIDDLNISKLSIKRKKLFSRTSLQNKIPLSEIMVENSSYGTNSLKKRLIKENVLDYICVKCKNNGTWQNEKLVLQLEHKNGNSKDHRLENLCLLCPNCHSQTSTYSGRNSSAKRKGVCVDCGAVTRGNGKKCQKCSSINQPKKFIVSKEELQELVLTKPMKEIGRKFGVSDNAIRKRCTRLGIEVPKNRRGYWSKKRATGYDPATFGLENQHSTN